MRRFERYVLDEIIPAFLGALAVVILLFLLVALQEVLAPLLAKGANPLLVGKLLALNIPWAISQALPLGLMFATLLGLSRLASDSEIKGAQAGGIPIMRLMWPVLTLALGVAALSFAIGEGVTPRTRVAEQTVQRQIIFDNPRVIGLGTRDAQGRNLVLTDSLGRAISVGELAADGTMRDLRIVTMQVGQPPREVITARSGKLSGNVLTLQDGERITYQSARPITVLTFRSGTLPVQDVQANFDQNASASGSLKPIDLPLKTLLERTNAYRFQKVAAPAEFTALHRKFSEPLAAIALTFFAVSLAVYTFRSSINLGFTWAILLAFAYYATWSVFRIMGEQGALPPALAAFAPDTIAVLAGALLLWLANRR
ncbi:YjgP/YjgQ family permease [Deinococcus cavernae]|uniref:YjgP/YjgQ family permease n=1 Tax=Deinococcus cavernae TaxID=2320857 RepID=A0A418V8Z8_9DEIO|nr:LptF/LptG family permease [Deinococcus cavernae]RJF72570.1 YjgP/YjgQ family permease [Deinococcus cavernae]